MSSFALRSEPTSGQIKPREYDARPAMTPEQAAEPSRAQWSAEDEGPEPFGQSGVRQHLGRWLAWTCIVGAVIASAMWYRSTFFYDSAQWTGKSQTLNIRSIHSRVMIDAAGYDFRSFNLTGWTYRGGYTRRVNDAWADTIWKAIGVEISVNPLDAMAQHGFWIRVKWPFIVCGLLILPLVRMINIRLSRWREARE